MSDPTNFEEALRLQHKINVKSGAETIIKTTLMSGEVITLQIHHFGTDYIYGDEIDLTISGDPVNLKTHNAGRFVKFDAIATSQCFSIKDGKNLNFEVRK
jgi:hypothetical protein